jgi:hypothetical protein
VFSFAKKALFVSATFVATGLITAGLGRAEITVEQLPDRVRVQIDGQLFTEYRHGTDAPHVYFYPVIGPGGAKMTRAWPMEDLPGEEHDHPHHRSLWYSHGDVNGIDFWSEPASHKEPDKVKSGRIVHEKLLEAKGGKEGVIKAQLKWVAPDGSIPLRSVQTFRVHSTPANERLIDFDVTLTAGEKEVVLGDTKEGTMALRIAESMRLAQPKKQAGRGRIANDQGVEGAAVWGKHANWVDMSGPIDGRILGIAMFDHPNNPRHPTRWHARDYGLFAANPFCENEMDKSQPKGAGAFKIAPGQSATFRYRIYIHEGDEKQAKVGERFAQYAAEAK